MALFVYPSVKRSQGEAWGVAILKPHSSETQITAPSGMKPQMAYKFTILRPLVACSVFDKLPQASG